MLIFREKREKNRHFWHVGEMLERKTGENKKAQFSLLLWAFTEVR